MFRNCCCPAVAGVAGGIGKTRMAMLLYNQLKSRFTHTAVVKLEATDSGNMLLERLFGLLTDLEFQGVEPPAEPHDDITQLQSQLHTFVQGKSVLLLVDNVCSAQQLDALLPPVSCFGPGSRVIITSRLASMPDSDQYKVGIASCCAEHCMQQLPWFVPQKVGLPVHATKFNPLAHPPLKSKMLPYQGDYRIGTPSTAIRQTHRSLRMRPAVMQTSISPSLLYSW